MQGYGLVLGSDVCYSVRALPALFAAAARLLARRLGAEFWLGYVSRCAQRNAHARVLPRHLDKEPFSMPHLPVRVLQPLATYLF